jgi:membrane protease YdiL (CAAX protease family)
LVGFAAVAAGERLPKSGLTAPVILQQVFKASMTAAVVALIEELLFRGILLRLLARNLSGTAAVVTSAAIYSAVHFLDRPPQPEAVESLTGFWVLGQMCRGLLQPSALWPGFASLLVVGWILGRSYLATGTLWLGVGLTPAGSSG